MEKHAQPFDVCIVCALHEEAEAVLSEFSTRCNVSFLKEFSDMDRYEYRYTSIVNNRGEPLTVLVTWLSESGPTQTGLDLKPFLHEFRPRFVAMTGFCAGYKKKVRWGDLIVAQYAYFYEAGKVIRESEGLSRHLQEMKVAASTSQVLQYARGFDGWKEPVKKMKSDRVKRQLKDTEEPRRVIGPMASGMAVRQDDPFPWLREYYDRNTVGLDMEAATFYQALRAISHIHGLVVKGVCDHADLNKKDTYHDYAARASAVYLLAFIREYVTEQSMPRRDALPLSSLQSMYKNKETLQQYLTAVINSNQSISPTGISSQALISVSVPLNKDIFIHLHTVSDRPLYDIPAEQKQLLEELKILRQRSDLGAEGLEEHIQQLRAVLWHSQLGQELIEARQGKEATIEDVLHNLKAAYPVAVLLGSPGSGKSTTMRWLALQMAHASRTAGYQLSEILFPRQIPILIRISDYANLLSKPVTERFTFQRFLNKKLSEVDSSLPDIIQDELRNGHCLLLFDGLDEVASDDIRRRVMDAIYSFIVPYLKEEATAESYNRFIVTSRIAAYEAGPFARYAHYTLLDLEDEQIEQFLAGWCPAIERHLIRSTQGMKELTRDQEMEAQTLGAARQERLLDAIMNNPSIKRLAVNPLMLTILALIQRSSKTLPHRRIDLYQIVTRTLLDNWNQETGRKLFSDEEIGLAEQLLSKLAYQLHRGDLLITEQEVKKITSETMADFYGLPINQIKPEKVKDFIEVLRRSSGLFVERGQGLFGFMHRTFQEYYTALYLVDKKHFTHESLKQFVSKYYRIAIWREPLLLTIAYKSEQRDRDERKHASELIQAIVEEQNLSDTILHLNLLFAANSVVDCNAWYINKEPQRHIAEQILDLYGDTFGAGRYTRLQQDIEEVMLLWLRGQPPNSNTWPPLVETWHKALCNSNDLVRQTGAVHLIAAIAPRLSSSPKSILNIFIPPLLHLANLQELYEDYLTCPAEVRMQLKEIAVSPASPILEEYAIVALRLLGADGPAGWLHADWVKWSAEQPQLLELLTDHSLELGTNNFSNPLLTPVDLPDKINSRNWSLQLSILNEWEEATEVDLLSFQTRLLQVSDAARYPQAYIFKRMLDRELTSSTQTNQQSWYLTWNDFLQEEMARGRSATYQMCLNLRLLLSEENKQQRQGIASELVKACSSQTQEQTQALIRITTNYLRGRYGASEPLRNVLRLVDLLDMRDILALRDVLCFSKVLEVVELLNDDLEDGVEPLEAIEIMKLLCLDIRKLRDEPNISSVFDIRNLRDQLYLDALDLEGDLGYDNLINLLCDTVPHTKDTELSIVLLAIYCVLDSYVYSDQIRQKIQGVLLAIPESTRKKTTVMSTIRQKIQGVLLAIPQKVQPLRIEQGLLIEVISRKISRHPRNPSIISLNNETPDLRAINLSRLKQQEQLARSEVEEILSACTDTRNLSKDIQEKLKVSRVQTIAWNLVSQPFHLETDVLELIVHYLDNDDAIICAAAALLLQNSKAVSEQTQKDVVQKILKILANDELSHRLLNPPDSRDKVWRLDDLLFETLNLGARKEIEKKFSVSRLPNLLIPKRVDPTM